MNGNLRSPRPEAASATKCRGLSIVVGCLAILSDASACGQAGAGRPERPRCGDEPLGFEFSLSAPIMHIDRRVAVSPDGRGEVEVRTSWSMPGRATTDVVGTFAAPVPAQELASLVAYARGHGLARGGGRGSSGPQPLTDSFPSLVLTCGGRRLPVEPTQGNMEALNAVAERLTAMAAAIVEHPARAVRLTLEGGAEGRPLEAVLTQVGPEPVAIVLHEPGTAGMTLRLRLDDWGAAGPPTERGARQPAAQATMTAEQVGALAAEGVIPPGIRTLAPGESLRIPLGGLALPAAGGARQLTVTASFWRPGPGLSRASVEVESAPFSIP